MCLIILSHQSLHSWGFFFMSLQQQKKKKKQAERRDPLPKHFKKLFPCLFSYSQCIVSCLPINNLTIGSCYCFWRNWQHDICFKQWHLMVCTYLGAVWRMRRAGLCGGGGASASYCLVRHRAFWRTLAVSLWTLPLFESTDINTVWCRTLWCCLNLGWDVREPSSNLDCAHV